MLKPVHRNNYIIVESTLEQIMSLKYSKSLSPMDSSDTSSTSHGSNIEHQEQNLYVPSVNFFQEIKAAIFGWIGSKVSN